MPAKICRSPSSPDVEAQLQQLVGALDRFGLEHPGDPQVDAHEIVDGDRCRRRPPRARPVERAGVRAGRRGSAAAAVSAADCRCRRVRGGARLRLDQARHRLRIEARGERLVGQDGGAEQRRWAALSQVQLASWKKRRACSAISGSTGCR